MISETNGAHHFYSVCLSKPPSIISFNEIFSVCIVGHADLLTNVSNPAGLRMHEQRWDIAVTHNWIGISDWIFMHFRPLNLPFIEEKNNLFVLIKTPQFSQYFDMLDTTFRRSVPYLM